MREVTHSPPPGLRQINKKKGICPEWEVQDSQEHGANRVLKSLGEMKEIWHNKPWLKILTLSLTHPGKTRQLCNFSSFSFLI